MREFDALSMKPAVLEHFPTHLCVYTVAHQQIAPVTNSAAQSIATQVDGDQPERSEIESAETEDDLAQDDDGLRFH